MATLITGNLLSLNEQSAETDGTGWIDDTNCATAQSTTKAYEDTHSIAMTAAGSGDMACRVNNDLTVSGSTSYTLSACVIAGSTGRSTHVYITWFDSGWSFISMDTGGDVTNNSSTWVQPYLTATSPSGATYAQVFVFVGSANASEVHYLDFACLRTDPTLPTLPGGGTTYAALIPTLPPNPFAPRSF